MEITSELAVTHTIFIIHCHISYIIETGKLNSLLF